MLRYTVATLLSAVCLNFVFGQIPGFSFTGGFGLALLLAALLSTTAVFFKAVGKAMTLTFNIRTAGRASFVLVPVWLLGIWLVPALELLLTAKFFPQLLSVQGLSAAMTAAGFLTLLQAATNNWSDTLKRPCQC